MKQHFILLSLIAGIFFIGTDIAFAQSLENIIVDFSLFLRYIILPFLISIAFLYFLINMAKYFIIQGGSDEGRTKAKRSAIYGIAAFVFLFSIWGIVTWVVEGVLNNTQYETSLCPDYLSGFCGNDNRGSGPTGATFPGITPSGGGSVGTGGGYTGGSGTGTGGSTGGGYTGGSGTGTGGSTGGGYTGGSGTGGTGTGGGDTSSTAGLAELVFGTGKDNAAFTTYTGSPRSTYNAPTVANTATCEDGLTTLSLAARTETTQAAYILYKTQSGATRWENITDLNSTNHISYDRDVLEGILSGNIQKPHVIHTHPKTRSDAQGLVMDGHGPSAADMRAMCELNNASVTYLTVDRTGVWRMRQQSDTCPYNTSATTVLPLLETYNDLASLDSSQREYELSKYTSSSIVPSTYKSHFSALDVARFSSYTPEEIIGLAAGYQTYASTTVAYSQSIVDFCRTY